MKMRNFPLSNGYCKSTFSAKWPNHAQINVNKTLSWNHCCPAFIYIYIFVFLHGDCSHSLDAFCSFLFLLSFPHSCQNSSQRRTEPFLNKFRWVWDLAKVLFPFPGIFFFFFPCLFCFNNHILIFYFYFILM